MAPGAILIYRVRIAGIPVRWRTRVVSWDPARSFDDVQDAGPFRLWWHQHTFAEEGGRTVMEDRVCYAPPIRWLERPINALVVAPILRAVFQYRADIIRLRFGA